MIVSASGLLDGFFLKINVMKLRSSGEPVLI